MGDDLFELVHVKSVRGDKMEIAACAKGDFYNTRRALPPEADCHCGCSSGVEHFLAKEDVARSNRVTRSIFVRWLRSSVFSLQAYRELRFSLKAEG
jgi:hypothetical protein